MCGRVFQTHDLNRLIRISRAERINNSGRYRTHYNMGPKNYLSTVRNVRNMSNKEDSNEIKSVEAKIKASHDDNSDSKSGNIESSNCSNSDENNNLSPINQKLISIINKTENNNHNVPKAESINRSDTINLIKSNKTLNLDVPLANENSNFESKNLFNEASKSETFPDRQLDFLNWGHTTPNFFVINARIEELPEKEMFKYIVNTNRCAVIVEGFYEWNPNKQAFSFINKEDNFFFIAALYTKDDNIILLTKEAPKKLSVVHHRMPVLLEEKELEIWLDVKTHKFNNILRKYIINEENDIWNKVQFQMVAPYVSSVQNNTKLCLMSQKDYLDKNGIEKFFVKKVKTSEKVEKTIVLDSDTKEAAKKEQLKSEVVCEKTKIEKKKLELESNEGTTLIPSKRIK